MQFAGKVAVITGGASGIGRGTALAMADAGQMSSLQISTTCVLRRHVPPSLRLAGVLWPCIAMFPKTPMSSAWAKTL